MVGPLNNSSELLAMRAAQAKRLAMNQAINRLATGSRINHASENPAGVIASLSMDATLAELEAESYANQRAINMASTADAGLGQISDILVQAKTLATANANDAGLTSEEKQANQLEIDSILASVDRIANTTSFAGNKLLDGGGRISATGNTLSIKSAQTGEIGNATIDATQYTLSDIGSGESMATTGGHATSAIAVINSAITQIASSRGSIGAFASNSLRPRLGQLASSRQQIFSAVSLIRDADYAMETSARIRSEILEKSSILLLRTDRNIWRSVLSLLA